MPGLVHVMRNKLTSHVHAHAGCAATALAAALLLAGCATTAPEAVPAAPATPSPEAVANAARNVAAQETLTKMVALQDRLYRVAAPLLINNADLCKSQARNLLGFTAKNKYSYPGEFAEAAQTALGYGERLQVSGVLAGSGAAAGGLRTGDGLLTVEGKALPSGPNAEGQAAAILGPLVAGRASLNMSIARGNATQALVVPVTRACAFRVDLGNADNVNSYADGQRVLITRGMITFAQNDESIAYVLAKDMAHNILGHPVTQRSTGTLAGIIDNLNNVRPDVSVLVGSAGIKAMPQEMDAAADRLALYLLARGGYNIDNVAYFWQRLTAQYPATVLNSYTANHPATLYRVAVINKTVAEIKAKRAAKRPLVP